MTMHPRAQASSYTTRFCAALLAIAAYAVPACAQTPAPTEAPAAAPPAAPLATAATPAATPFPDAVPPAPVLLNHPAVVDTAHLKSGDTVVTLFGIQGWGGDPAHNLQQFVTANGDRVTCEPHQGGTYTCTLPTGLDVASAALANGAAKTEADSPADYQHQEVEAQQSQLGLWAGTPAPPLVLRDPTVETTANLTAGRQTVTLDGLIGFPAQFYTLQLQNYISAHGNRLTCKRQPNGHYVCLLPDGSDLASVALRNGLARINADANSQYRSDQATAVATKTGIWFNPPSDEGLVPIPVLQAPPTCCTYAPGDVGGGLNYVDGVPFALIGGEPEFFDYVPALGFGFFDVERRFHHAPEPFLDHLNRFHPAGAGLRQVAAPQVTGRTVAFQAPNTALPVPQVFTPSAGIGFARPIYRGAGSLRPSVPSYAQFRAPLLEPRRGFTGVGGFHPGTIAAPHIAPVFAGRR